MESVAVISASGKKLMPTNPYRARKLLKNKRAVKYKHKPIFTIKMVEFTAVEQNKEKRMKRNKDSLRDL